jgi:hypothetical protein
MGKYTNTGGKRTEGDTTNLLFSFLTRRQKCRMLKMDDGEGGMEWYEDGAGEHPADCWGCGCEVSAPERRELAGLLAQPLAGGVYCRSCRETRLQMCTECSARYAVDGNGLCDVCVERSWITLEESW